MREGDIRPPALLKTEEAVLRVSPSALAVGGSKSLRWLPSLPLLPCGANVALEADSKEWIGPINSQDQSLCKM